MNTNPNHVCPGASTYKYAVTAVDNRWRIIINERQIALSDIIFCPFCGKRLYNLKRVEKENVHE
jgi:hypothetical protein